VRPGPALLSTRIIRTLPIWFRVMQRKAPPKRGQSLGIRPRGRPAQILSRQAGIVHTRTPERCTSIGITFSSGPDRRENGHEFSDSWRCPVWRRGCACVGLGDFTVVMCVSLLRRAGDKNIKRAILHIHRAVLGSN
jgi:hypothetical protein